MAVVKDFAAKISTDILAGHISVLDLHFDKGTFVKRVVTDAYWDEQLAAQDNKTYKTDYEKQLLTELSLARMFLAGVNTEQYFAYDMVKTYQIDERWHAVFRMYANQAINYHDYLLRIDSNKVWIEDVYIMTVGRELSQIMKEMYVAGIPSAEGDAKWNDHSYLAKTKELMAQKQFSPALATFDSLSSDFKAQKSMRLFNLQLLGNVPDEQYIRAIEAYEKDFPDDAGTLLLQLDKNFMFGNYPEVLKGLARLETIYGPDAVVSFLRGNAYYGLGQCEKANAAYKDAVKTKKDWPEPWQNNLECWVRNNNYQNAIPILDTLAARFDFTPTYCKFVLADYPDFLNSSAFKAWKAKQEAEKN